MSNKKSSTKAAPQADTQADISAASPELKTQQRVLEALREARAQIETLQQPRDERIAIIGMATRLPGAESVTEFWNLLEEGRSGIRKLSEEELRDAGIDESTIGRDDYVPAWASFDDPAAFDASFFGYSPREATVLDPQHRVFLECAWHAMEDAALDTADRSQRVGVYAGAALNSYLINLNNDRSMRESVTPVQAVVSNVMGLMPTRTAYHLDLNGPACGIQTACSTSLVAIHTACRSLLDDDCDVALAGGVTICLPTPEGYIYEKGGIASPDAICRAFDAEGEGTVFGNGVGVVVLKPLAAARADGDNIVAVIAASAINNDGADKVGLLAPSVSGQCAVIQDAWRRSGLDPADVDYIEAHGTATELGDPIEFAALDKALGSALREQDRQCAIGSVKTNLGHLDAAAGVAGLIKTILAMQHEMLPPSLNFNKPNPQIDLDNSPFFVISEATPWLVGGRPRRAGISSFGMGGTNAHIVIEEPTLAEVRAECKEIHWQLLPLSAKQPATLDAVTQNLAACLSIDSSLCIDDIAHTLQSGRKAFEHRRLCMARNTEEAISCLESPVLPSLQSMVDESQVSLVFMFSGQGSQYPGMARQLLKTEPVFRETLQQCADILAPQLDLLDLLSANTDPEVLHRTEHAQPVLFSLEYALAKLWQSKGIEADVFIGHSIGEYVAACLAGVFSLPDALSTVALRGGLMQSCEPGAMLAILQDRDSVEKYLSDTIELAAHNASNNCVVSGTEAAITALHARLDSEAIACQRLDVSHAFHSTMMTPALDSFRQHLENVRLTAPSKEIVSNLTGEWLTDEQATSPAYWVEHLRNTVRFAAGLDLLATVGTAVFLEIGAGETLSRFVTATLGNEFVAIPGLPGVQQAMHTERVFAQAFGRLWLAGMEVNWQRWHMDNERPRQKVSLPGYPFQRVHLFPQADVESNIAESFERENVDEYSSDVGDWFHVPAWTRTAQAKLQDVPVQCRIIAGADSISDGLIQPTVHRIVRVESGNAFVEKDDLQFIIDPCSEDDISSLFKALDAKHIKPDHWVQTSDREGAHDLDALIVLGKVLQQRDSAMLLSIVSREAMQVTGTESATAERACIIGMVQVMSQEIPLLKCRIIDLSVVGENSEHVQLVNELDSAYTYAARQVALRGRYRWLKRYSRLPLQHQQSSLLQDGTTYLIVGDLVEGLGMIYAKLLRRELNARVILVGRQDLPASDEWEQRLATHGTLHPVSQFIQRMKALGEEGEHWQLHSIDLTDGEALSQAVAHGSKLFGEITGVFHADVMGDAAACSLDMLDSEQRKHIMRHKVNGTLALAECLSTQQPAFVMLQSSMSALAGGVGFAAYSAANCFLDACASLNTTASRWISINWDACQLDDHAQSAHKTSQSTLMAGAFTAEEVWLATQRVLAEPDLVQVVVTARPLMPRIEQALNSEATNAIVSGQSHLRPDMSIEYAEPETSVELAVASALSELLGIDKVGRNDDFFALGGNSLLAIQAVTRLRKEFGVELPMRALLFGTPTVAGIAEVIEQSMIEHNMDGLTDDNFSAVEDLLDEIEDLSPEEAAAQQESTLASN